MIYWCLYLSRLLFLHVHLIRRIIYSLFFLLTLVFLFHFFCYVSVLINKSTVLFFGRRYVGRLFLYHYTLVIILVRFWRWNFLKLRYFYLLLLITIYYSKWTFGIGVKRRTMSKFISRHNLLYHLYLYSNRFLKILNNSLLRNFLYTMNLSILIVIQILSIDYIGSILDHLDVLK